MTILPYVGPTVAASPSGSLAVTVNGRPISSVPNNFVQLLSGLYGPVPAYPPGPYYQSNPYDPTAPPVLTSAPNVYGTTNYSAIGAGSKDGVNQPAINDILGGVQAPHNGPWMVGYAGPTGVANQLGSPGAFGAGGYFEGLGVNSDVGSSPALGSHTVEIKPFCQAVVTQFTGNVGQYIDFPTYYAIPGATVTIKVITASGTYYLLDNEPTSGPVPVPGSPGAYWVAHTLPAALDQSLPLGSLGLESRFPNGFPISFIPMQPSEFPPAGFSPGKYGYGAIAARAYDPYFGADPNAAKDVVYLDVTITFPNGRVWHETIQAEQGPSRTYPNAFLPTLGLADNNDVAVTWNGTNGQSGRYGNAADYSEGLGPGPVDPGSVLDYDPSADIAAANIEYVGAPTTGPFGGPFWNYYNPGTQPASGSGLVFLPPSPMLGMTWVFTVKPGYNWGNPFSPGSSATTMVKDDGNRRPSAILCPGSGPSYAPGTMTLTASDDAGTTFNTPATVAGSTTYLDGNLIIQKSANRHAVVAADGNGGLYYGYADNDGEAAADWHALTKIPNLTGSFPICAQHPETEERVLMCYLDGSNNLEWSLSDDGGATWTGASDTPIDVGLDFSLSGRPGLCWSGSAAYVVYASEKAANVSQFVGGNWNAPIPAATDGPYGQISAASIEGIVYAAFSDGAALHLFSSGDGETWTAGTAPPVGNGTEALGVSEQYARLWWGTTHHSDDGGASWQEN